MGNSKLRIILLFLIIVVPSCEKFELKGFLTTYENVNHRFEQSLEYNYMNSYSEIDIAQDSYIVYAMGDSHVGEIKNLDRFLKDAMNENVAAAILDGDLTNGHHNNFELLAEHLPQKDELMYFPIVGNHDLYFDGWKYFQSVFGSSSYIFVVNSVNASDLFICLDTGGGTLGNKQLNWFRKLLESDREKYRYCTVFTHNNIFRLNPTFSTNPMVEEIQTITDLFVRFNVNMVVTGHDHKRNTAILGNTTHIIMDALHDSNDDASYLKLSINDEDIDYSFVDL